MFDYQTVWLAQSVAKAHELAVTNTAARAKATKDGVKYGVKYGEIDNTPTTEEYLIGDHTHILTLSTQIITLQKDINKKDYHKRQILPKK